MSFPSVFRGFVALLGIAVSSASNAAPIWATYGATQFGTNAAIASSTQSFSANVAGAGVGSGNFTTTFSTAGTTTTGANTNTWNGLSVGNNDDGYIQFTGGAPGIVGAGISALNIAGIPAGLPIPTPAQAMAFDAADGHTTTVTFNFGTLAGGGLQAGSWVYIGDIDQGELVTVSAASPWYANAPIFTDTTTTGLTGVLPFASGLSPSASVSTNCNPLVNFSNGTNLTLVGTYGVIAPGNYNCSAFPFPVAGVTVGYTSGSDSPGTWIQTSALLTQLSITFRDQDTEGAGTIDNNYVNQIGILSNVTAAAVPAPGTLWLLGIGLMALGRVRSRRG